VEFVKVARGGACTGGSGSQWAGRSGVKRGRPRRCWAWWGRSGTWLGGVLGVVRGRPRWGRAEAVGMRGAASKQGRRGSGWAERGRAGGWAGGNGSKTCAATQCTTQSFRDTIVKRICPPFAITQLPGRIAASYGHVFCLYMGPGSTTAMESNRITATRFVRVRQRPFLVFYTLRLFHHRANEGPPSVSSPIPNRVGYRPFVTPELRVLLIRHFP